MIDQRLAVESLRLQSAGDGQALNDTKKDGQVASVLGDLAAAQLAFFRETLEVWEHHGHQLQNDRRGDVGHDAQGKNRHAAEIAAAEEIEDAQHGTGGLAEKLVQDGGIDAGKGNVRTNAIDRQQRQREHDTVPQILNAEHVFHGFDESIHAVLSCSLLFPTKTFVLLRPLPKSRRWLPPRRFFLWPTR